MLDLLHDVYISILLHVILLSKTYSKILLHAAFRLPTWIIKILLLLTLIFL